MRDEHSGTFNTAMWCTVLGALIGGILSITLAPRAIAWYFNPPAQLGFSCNEPIKWALGKLQTAQLAGAIGGAVLGLLIYFATRRRTHAQKAVPA